MRTPMAVGAAGLASVTLLHVRDPHAYGSYGLCPFRALTGLWCPGCGGLRAVNDLTHLEFGPAVSSNVVVVALVLVVGVAFLWWLPRRWRGENARMLVLDARGATVVLALLAVFTIVRNTPWGASLAP